MIDLKTIQEQINRIKSQMPSIGQKIQQLAKSRGKSVVSPPSPPKPIVHTPSSKATNYQVPKRNVLGQIKQRFWAETPTGTKVPFYGTQEQAMSYFKSKGYTPLSGLTGKTPVQVTGTEKNKIVEALREKIGETAAKISTLKQQLQQKIQTRQGEGGGGEKIEPLEGENITEVIESYINKYLPEIDYAELAEQAKRIAEATYQPIENKLKDIIDSIKDSYKRAQEDLLEKQKREIEELRGAYAVRGLLNSGTYQKALQELQKLHARELNDLIQREQQDITNISYEVAAKKPTAIDNILRLMTSELQQQRQRASILLGTLLSSHLAESRAEKEREWKEKQVATTTTVVDKNGNKYLVLLDRNGNEIKRIYIGKETPETPPASQWTLQTDAEGNLWRVNKVTGKAEQITGFKGATKGTDKDRIINDTIAKLQEYAGRDGYVSPEIYKKLKDEWRRRGYNVTVGDFDKLFASTFVNPSHPEDYGSGLNKAIWLTSGMTFYHP